MPPRAHSPARTPISNRHVNLLRTVRLITCRQTFSNGANIRSIRSSLRSSARSSPANNPPRAFSFSNSASFSAAVPCMSHRNASVLIFEPHVLVGGPNRQRHQIDRMVGHPGTDPNQHPSAPNRRKHHAVNRQLLDMPEQGFALCEVPLAGLLLEQFVDVWVSAVGVAALGVNKRLDASGGVA